MDIKLIHKACQDYLDDPILRPFAEINLTEPQSSIDRILGNPQQEKIIPEPIVVAQKKKIVKEILQSNSVIQAIEILDRHDHGTMTNREFLQKTNSKNLSWLLLKMQVEFIIQTIKISRYFSLLWLSVPLTVIAVDAGIVYLMSIILATIMIYAVLKACYAIFQIYKSSLAFEKRSQELITELNVTVTQDYNVELITQLLQQFDLVYDENGNWIDRLINNPDQYKDKRTDDGSSILHVLLACQNPNYSYANIKKLHQAISIFNNQKYVRNVNNATAMRMLTSTDMYGFKYLLEMQDTSLFQKQYNKIDKFLANVHTNRRNAKVLVLLEGVSGTGKSQTVMDYIGKNKNFQVHRWEAGGSRDCYVGGLEARAGEFFNTIMKQAAANPREKFAIYLDNLDVICGSKGKETKEWMKALAGQFSYYIDRIRKESPNIIVVGTTRSALEMDASLLDHSDRVLFPLPTEEQRYGLLQQAFIETLVSSEQLQQLAQITEGWSHRALMSIASNLDKETVVTDENMEVALEKIRINLERDFTEIYPDTQIILPKFLKTNGFLNYQIVTPQPIEECLNKLRKYLRHPQYYDRTPMHTLLYGPPGGGKTTAIRNFCEEMNLPFVVIKSGISASDLSKAFEAINQYKYALVFIDEIDSFPHIGELLKQMDGFVANNTILIGATNKPDKVIAAGEGALGDRFHYKVYVPGLTPNQRANFIKWKVSKQLEHSDGLLQADADLTEQILGTSDCLRLAKESQTLTMRALSNHINSFWGERRCDAAIESTSRIVELEQFSKELIRASETQIIKPFV